MKSYFDQEFTFAAEQYSPASYAMFAENMTIRIQTAIILLMAVVLSVSVCSHLAPDITISIILGVIILIVREKFKAVSRTR